MRLSALLICGIVLSSAASAQQNETLKTIHSRKSVRHYTEKKISKDDLLVLIKAGMAAPTAGDKRPWSFVIIDEPATLAVVAELLPYGRMLKKAAAAIVVCGNPKRSFSGKESEYWIQDCSAATENILLAVESIGWGAVWLGVYPDETRIKSVRKALAIPTSDIPLCVISIGYPQGIEKPKDKFDPGQVHWNKW